MDDDLAGILRDFKPPEVVLPDGTVKFMPKNQRTFDTAATLERDGLIKVHRNKRGRVVGTTLEPVFS